MIWIYRIFFFPVLLISLPYYLVRMIKRGGYRQGFGERAGAGFLPQRDSSAEYRIWLQAVSVGELLAAEPLLRALNRRDGVEIILTTTTSSGYHLAREKLSEWVTAIRYFPLDSWFFSRVAWRKFSPDLVLHMESEAWPEHLHQARIRGVPVILLNARLSDRTFSRLQRVRPLARYFVDHFQAFLAASPEDARRWKALGAPEEKVLLTGNLKCDGRIPRAASSEDLARWRQEAGLGEDPILLGSSTWASEEEILLQKFAQLREKGHSVRLVLAPRHPERRREIRSLLGRTSWRVAYRTEEPPGGEVDIYVVDKIGELARWTEMASVVFIGKSLTRQGGGQSPLEAAALGKAIVMGPRMNNFRDISRSLVLENAARRVEDAESLGTTLEELWRDPAPREALGAAARAWMERNRGATARTMEYLRDNVFKE